MAFKVINIDIFHTWIWSDKAFRGTVVWRATLITARFKVLRHQIAKIKDIKKKIFLVSGSVDFLTNCLKDYKQGRLQKWKWGGRGAKFEL